MYRLEEKWQTTPIKYATTYTIPTASGLAQLTAAELEQVLKELTALIAAAKSHKTNISVAMQQMDPALRKRYGIGKAKPLRVDLPVDAIQYMLQLGIPLEVLNKSIRLYMEPLALWYRTVKKGQTLAEIRPMIHEILNKFNYEDPQKKQKADATTISATEYI